MKLRLLVATAGLILATAPTLWTAPPPLISVQGKLTDSSGDPLPAGMRQFEFAIFSSSVGGAPLWNESQSIASDASGLWVGSLGANVPLTEAVFSDTSRWLEITVAGETLPRVRLVTGPYAHRTITGGIGHNLPQEAPQAFVQAILDVDRMRAG